VRDRSAFAPAGLDLGCDYNPEQWPRETWLDDVRLMREAGITLVAVNIFGWARLQPRPDVFDFSELDEIVALLAANGIAINLGTGTSSPPPWLTRRHPEILPVVADGTTRWPGGRQAWCPSSPVFRRYALALTAAVGERYGENPAIRIWHVSNELGCHNALCYCDVSAAAFRRWLEARYGTIEALNRAWGTAFWSQHYSEWDDILPPRLTLSTTNPTQSLDFARFSSDEVLAHYRAEADLLRSLSSAPVTTNFMVTAHIRTQDYFAWAPHVDVVANDHYLDHRLDRPHEELAFAADLTRGIAGGRPWMLMEQSTGAVNWQPRNLAKAPGEMLRNTASHLARGADSICFFQWRASAQGSEKFHSAMLPHAGTDSTTWREVLELNRILRAVGEVAGSTVVAEVAIVFGWEAWWACDLDSRPSTDIRYLDQVHRVYRALWASGITVDIVAPGSDLGDYRVVIVPCLYLVSDADAASIAGAAESGAHVVITFFSGIVDEDDSVRLGGYPGAFRDLLGLRTEEFFPLPDGLSVSLDDGATAARWTEKTEVFDAQTVASYVDGPLDGSPAITRREVGDGVSWYLGTDLDVPSLRRFLDGVLSEAGVLPAGDDGERGGDGLEIVRRRSSDSDYLFCINHTDEEHSVPCSGIELTTGASVDGRMPVPAGAVRILRSARPPDPAPSDPARA
jgi:beta-galactosidase